MGFTHYWKPKHNQLPVIFTDSDWNRLKEVAEKVFTECEKRGIVLTHNDPNTKPEVNDSWIWFNGDGDLGHETFILYKKVVGFSFCKTARKPYNIAVTAILIYANYLNPELKISSDGNLEDWQAGHDLLYLILKEAIPYPDLNT